MAQVSSLPAAKNLTIEEESRRSSLSNNNVVDVAAEEHDFADVVINHVNPLHYQHWFNSLCFVKFDLELGPIVEYQYPLNQYNATQLQSIAALAFPDSHSANLGDTTFCFRLRLHNNDNVYGFVCFRQVVDKTSARGYFQKSSVLLSHLPLTNIFERIISIIGSAYHEYGSSITEAAINNVNSWPSPNPGKRVTLPILGHTIQEQLPRYSHSLLNHSSHLKRNSSEAAHNSTKVSLSCNVFSIDSVGSSGHISSGLFAETNLFQTFGTDLLHNLWYCWELIMTGEPLLVIASSPAVCSHLVLSLVSLISPVHCKSDYRPYFTIYDQDFKHFNAVHDISGGNSLPSIILGVTNPFFLKSLHKFPHILCVGDQNNARSGVLNDKFEPNQGESGGETAEISGNHKVFSQSKVKISSDTANLDILALTSGDSQFLSHSAPLLTVDEQILKRLIIPKPKLVNNHTSSAKSKLFSSKLPSKNKGSTDKLAINTKIGQDKYSAAESSSASAVLTPTGKSAAISVNNTNTNIHYVHNNSNNHYDSDYHTISEINNALLRKAFRDLTENFLLPFKNYVNYTATQHSYYCDQLTQRLYSWNPYLQFPQLPKFNETDFLNIINTCSTAELPKLYPILANIKPSRRSKLHSLYSSFIRSPHFYSWFSESKELSEFAMYNLCFNTIKLLAEDDPSHFYKFLDGLRLSQALAMFKRAFYFLNRINKQAILQQAGSGLDVKLASAIEVHLGLIKKVVPAAQLPQFIQIEQEERTRLHKMRHFGNNSNSNSVNNSTNTSTNSPSNSSPLIAPLSGSLNNSPLLLPSSSSISPDPRLSAPGHKFNLSVANINDSHF
jgi:hypothetical protein